ncbi:MAG: hypothetical protein RIE08_08915 [Acidimicrobiales bacterium]
MDRLERLCAKLHEEPFLHLSLHSKELFHSNFLGWLCEAYPGEMAAELERWVPCRDGNDTKVLREKDQLDLAVQLPGLAPFIVENKVFAPPDEMQLDRYAAGNLAGFHDPTLILLSLTDPGWREYHSSPNGPTWHYRSFTDLADLIRAVADRLHEGSAPSYQRDLVDHYSEFLRMLTELVGVAGRLKTDDPISLPSDAAGLLQEIRLHDGISKLRARSAIALVQEAAEGARNPAVDWEAGFTRGNPLLAAFVELANGDRLGWQYQAGQWRLAVICGREELVGRTGDQGDARKKYVQRNYGDWFDFDPIPELVDRQVNGVPKLETAGDFNSYKPDFVYRYRRLPDLTTTEICKLSNYYLDKAQSWPS